jgi:hypothetical protein
LQRWLRDSPDALGEHLFVVAEEYGDFEEARRRIDLLALDEEANLVVIELKRTDDGGSLDLQAVRYAALISAMTFDDVVRAHEAYLRRRGLPGAATQRILSFLGASDPEQARISKVPRIILVSQDFSLEITTTVLWLVERGLDMKCVQLTPYRVHDQLFLSIRQVLPLEEATDYQVRIRQKDEIVRRATSGHRERTLNVLARHGLISTGSKLEIVPDARPGLEEEDARVYKATVANVDARESIVWEFDGTAYSLTALTNRLVADNRLVRLANNTFMHWRIVGDTESMWQKAEQLARAPSAA